MGDTSPQQQARREFLETISQLQTPDDLRQYIIQNEAQIREMREAGIIDNDDLWLMVDSFSGSRGQ